jgi:hypothetical protein
VKAKKWVWVPTEHAYERRDEEGRLLAAVRYGSDPYHGMGEKEDFRQGKVRWSIGDERYSPPEGFISTAAPDAKTAKRRVDAQLRRYDWTLEE